MPATVRLAEAPMSVPLPPRQAPSDSAHHSGMMCWGPPRCGAICLISGIIAATNGMLSTIAESTAEPQRMATAVVSKSPPVHRHELLRREAEHARDIDAVHDDEQAEEEDRDPVDLVEGLRHLGGTPSRRVTPASPARSAAPW